MNTAQLQHCHDTIRPHIHRTPVLTSSQLNHMAGCELYFKCENFQKMGAFKMRGATYAISQLSEEARSKGVVTHSSGNFAQALSLAAQSLGVKAYIVMPLSKTVPTLQLSIRINNRGYFDQRRDYAQMAVIPTP